ncbi:hypothetical protein D477_018801 [Arthrobacter crystallopoietes BAB-32]|uniref:Uncharacterized protein n=2 Tax=Crystallibacter crystallopoietes TaxID=37928 RepID=N1UQP4_9MICC|nr:hypothetical protein D477_018801 [Arthrobacter crystallopoietes BAB-32]
MNLDELDQLVHEEETDSAAGKTRLVGRNLAAALGFTLVAAAAFAGVALIVMSQLAHLASATAQAQVSASSYLDGELPGSFEITEAVRTEQIGQLSVVEVSAAFDTGFGDAGTAMLTVGCEKLLVQRCEVLEADGLPV